MSHILHHNIQTQTRTLPYAKWYAIGKQYVYPNRSGTLASLSSPSKLASVQLVLNFCLPAAMQLSHPKGMCLNAALNKIAFKTHRIFQVKVCNLYQEYLNVPEHAVKRNYIPHLRAPESA